MKSRFIRKLTLLILFFTTLSYVQGKDNPINYHNSSHGKLQSSKIAQFSYPWGMTFISKTEALVTERGGGFFLVNLNTGKKQSIINTPKVASYGQGGLLDVITHPRFNQNKFIYLSYVESREGGLNLVVSRLLFNKNGNKATLSKLKPLYRSKSSRTGRHFGSRFVFAKDGTLFFTIGDHGERNRSQDVKDPAGSVIRINDDGSIPADNPTFKGGVKGLFSIGHRNAQGAALHPETGELWVVEHGARGGDEVNRALKGKNYGWPIISYGRHYWGGKIGEGTRKKGLEQPEFYWDPSIAPSGTAFYKGELFPKWNGDLFVGALKFRKVVRLTFKNGKVVQGEDLFEDDFGRIRDVRTGPNGAIWLLTDSSRGHLIRVIPNS